MRFIENKGCDVCQMDCDIYKTAKELNLEKEMEVTHVTYKRHEMICSQNALISHVVLMLEGNAKMFVNGLNNKNIILDIVRPSNYVGLLPVFGISHFPYSVSALDNCYTCQVKVGTIIKMYDENQGFQKEINHSIGLSVIDIMGKLVTLNQKHARGKVAESLLYLSKLFNKNKFTLSISRKELGEMSAISEENTVRVLTEFKNDGIIDLNGKEIELRDVDKLERISSVG